MAGDGLYFTSTINIIGYVSLAGNVFKTLIRLLHAFVWLSESRAATKLNIRKNVIN